MNADRWKQIEDCYHAAMERPVPERAAFLASVDPGVRREVESLLAHEGEADSLLENPAWRHVSEPSAITAGSQMGAYRIVSKLGEGGMGEVFRATDTKLHREVALKVVAREYASDPNWRARFEREARVLASLNHPHIAAVYGLEQSDGQCAIAMELVEGVSMAERMPKVRIPVAESLAIARQIAEALEYAHEAGVVHRDLKPANVKMRPDGVVKVLDFGLAKTIERKDAPAETATRTGIIMGTPAYMPPEQAAGSPVDRRADIWAFGVVVFEMLSGRQVYARKSTLETLAAVSRDEPPWDELPAETPAEIVRLLRRCLDRNAKNRLRDIGEARVTLEAALTGKTEAIAIAPKRRPWLKWSVAAVAAIGFAAISFVHFREKRSASAPPIRFEIPPLEGSQAFALLNMSPDGSKLAFISEGRLWVHFLESGESRNLTDARGTPFWSPDSRFIGYAAHDAAEKTFKLKKIEATGGVPQTLADIPSWGGGTWSQYGLIVFSEGPKVGLFQVPAAGGVPTPVTAPLPTLQYAPFFLPDGRHFVYNIRGSRDDTKSAIYLGSVDLKPDRQPAKPLVGSFWQPIYAPSADPGLGYLLFIRDETLMAQPFDNRRLALTGQAAPVAEAISDGRAFSASANGVLVFRRNTRFMQPTWHSQEGTVLGTAGEYGFYWDLELSPDGTHAALVTGNQGQAKSISLLDLSRGTSEKFAFGSGNDKYPVWSPDGRNIIFASDRDGTNNLYRQPAHGENNAELLLSSSDDKVPMSWSPDGRYLFYTDINAKNKRDIWVLPLEGDKKPIPFLVTGFNQDTLHLSPDGHWVVYASDESGKLDTFVRPFSLSPDGKGIEPGEKWLISSEGGGDPRWRSDGREIYYEALDHKIMAVEITTSPAFRAGKPRPLGLEVSPDAHWDVTGDGRRFLEFHTNYGKPQPYTVVLNWQAGLK